MKSVTAVASIKIWEVASARPPFALSKGDTCYCPYKEGSHFKVGLFLCSLSQKKKEKERALQIGIAVFYFLSLISFLGYSCVFIAAGLLCYVWLFSCQINLPLRVRPAHSSVLYFLLVASVQLRYRFFFFSRLHVARLAVQKYVKREIRSKFKLIKYCFATLFC